MPDLNYITDSDTKNETKNQSHQGGANFQFHIKPKDETSDKLTQVANQISFGASNGENTSQTATLSRYSDGQLISDYTSENVSNSSNYNFNNNLRITPRKKKGQYLNFSLSTALSKGNTDGRRYAENYFYAKDSTSIQDQINKGARLSTNVGLEATWNKEIFPKFNIVSSYTTTVAYSKNDRYVYDFDPETGEYEDFNQNLSSEGSYFTTNMSPSMRLQYRSGNFHYSAGLNFISTSHRYEDGILEERSADANFHYLTYNGMIGYRDKKGKHNFGLNYGQSVSTPSLSQLQPVEDTENQLNIRTGNPDLNPTVNHTISAQYNRNITASNLNFRAETNAAFTKGKIVNITIIDEDLIRYTTYDNMDGDYSLGGSIGIYKAIFNDKTRINFNTSLSGNFSNSISVQNGLKLINQTSSLSPSVSFRIFYDKRLNFDVNYMYRHSNTAYDNEAYSNNSYATQALRLTTSAFFSKKSFISNTMNYQHNSRVGDAFDADAVFWNAGLGTQLFDGKASLSLVAYDILGKNNGYTRTVADDYIQDSDSNILRRYFMFTFSYNFGKFGGVRSEMGSPNSIQIRPGQ